MQLLAHEDDCQMVTGFGTQRMIKPAGDDFEVMLETGETVTLSDPAMYECVARQCTCTPVAIKLTNLGADSGYSTNVWLVPPSFEWAERDN